MSSVCVFCGSSDGAKVEYRAAAAHLGRELVAHKLDLVYGGGHAGLMGAVAGAVIEAGGNVTGIIPEAMVERGLELHGALELLIVATMHERKALMAARSDAFVMLPGGLGTFEEFFEVMTWRALGIHAKPVALLNVEGYFDPLIATIEHATSEGFIRRDERYRALVERDPAALVARIAADVDDTD